MVDDGSIGAPANEPKDPGPAEPGPKSLVDPSPPAVPGAPFPGTVPLGEVDPDALKVVRRLLAAGHEAYLVGGCVRDLYLGRRPKDFDVATSATPEAIRRLFRNSRIIGRRFKLAHVFFGPKIIETSTFRTTPQQQEHDDVLITHDNEWGTIEDDARRRDFTINGLFFDVDAEQVVDFVQGLDDLDRRLIRTIGAPILRFREDPVRMIRAIKFAARLDFDIEEDTWNALLEVAPDIVKCSQARVLEEIYKLLRGSAAAGSFELMQRARLVEHVMPRYLELYQRAEDGDVDPDDVEHPRQRLMRFLSALDGYHLATNQVASNCVLLAVMFAPLLQATVERASRQDLERAIEDMMTPACVALGVAKRDRELARQILMAYRRMQQPQRKRRHSPLLHRQYFHDALVFLGLAVKAVGGDGSELQHWRELATLQAGPVDERLGSGGEARRKKSRRRRKRRPTGGASETG